MMASIKIMTGHTLKLKSILGTELVDGIDVKPGHTVIEVDPEVEEQVAVGRAAFERLIRGGYAAFSVKEGPEPAVKIDEWDPDAHPDVLMVAPLAGG